MRVHAAAQLVGAPGRRRDADESEPWQERSNRSDRCLVTDGRKSMTTPRAQSMAVEDTLLEDCVRAIVGRHEAVDWRVEPGDFWCSVRPGRQPRRRAVQGWKLHLSATVLSAPHVLARAADVLVRHGCEFKFAHTLGVVRQLTSARYDRGGGGKFITAYPQGDEERLRLLAEELHESTAGLPGPGILSDRRYREGSLVHYRFGVFHGLPMLGNDGSYEAMLVDPGGEPVLDQRKAWFTPPAWAPRDPFRSAPAGATGQAAAPAAVLLDGRYAVSVAVRHAFRGGVYRATDQVTGEQVIVKQARAHVNGDLTGRDARDALRHEASLLERLGTSTVTPRLVGLFDQQGDLFLVQEAVAGVTLRESVWTRLRFADDAAWGPPAGETARLASRLIDLLEAVHGRGLVFQDFTPDNVMVTPEGDLRLIDVELAARPGETTVRAFTPGYGAPEQLAVSGRGPAPDQRVDLYGLGATLFYLASGVDPLLAPERPQARTTHERLRAWLAHMSVGNPVVRRLAAVILGLMDEDPGRRPGLAAVRDLLKEAPAVSRGVSAEPEQIGDAAVDGLIADGIDHLIATMEPENEARLWPATPMDRSTDPLNVQHGAAGVLGVLTRAYEVRPSAALGEAVAVAANWIRRAVPCEPRLLPGLQFGRSGTAWALLEAGRLLDDRGLVDVAADLALRVPLSWPNPDVCHGTAGAGLTQLRFWERTGNEEFLARTRTAADALLAAAERRDGQILWPVPQDFNSSLAGVVHYGFAHGVAGVGAFLLAAGRALGDGSYVDLAGEAADTLVSAARLKDGAAYWGAGPGDETLHTRWCSGSSGVGAFLLQMWRQTGDERLCPLLDQAATAIRRSRWSTMLGQCCGLAGGGEFLIDMADATGSPRCRRWAWELVRAACLRRFHRDGRQLIPDASGTDSFAYFGNGLSGILAFLIRLRHGGPRPWLPEAFAPGA
ncbi:class IV lanthionine synthetase LanL [Streptosporangium sp. NPDC050855]|uniref:class IV lanthionine synthetase LanL n=1 Tax=Streptosporangium sp. NPDC050855 TaxID=3366194 RepID=UPI00378CACC1